MKLTMTDLLGPNLILDVPLEFQRNLEITLERVNRLQDKQELPFIVTSGFRALQHHIDIYRTKALKAGLPFSNLQVPLKSRHLTGEAVDISDPTGAIYKWAYENQDVLKEIGLWCEKGTKGWLHCQTQPPKSGARFFLP